MQQRSTRFRSGRLFCVSGMRGPAQILDFEGEFGSVCGPQPPHLALCLDQPGRIRRQILSPGRPHLALRPIGGSALRVPRQAHFHHQHRHSRKLMPHQRVYVARLHLPKVPRNQARQPPFLRARSRRGEPVLPVLFGLGQAMLPQDRTQVHQHFRQRLVRRHAREWRHRVDQFVGYFSGGSF